MGCVTQTQGTCRIYAVIEASEAAAQNFTAAHASGLVAAALIVPPGGGGFEAQRVQPLVTAAQAAEVAALVAGDARLARTLKADGVHLFTGKNLIDLYAEARSVLGQRGVVGVDAGISRHDAMTLAEAGADYVAFGAPAHLKDRDKARGRREELIAWWAEIFEVPCIAFDVETPQEAAQLRQAGADFVGVRVPAGQTPATTRDWMADIAAALRAPLEAA